MDPVTGAILGKASEQITESLFKFMRREIGYVFHCNPNIEKLRAVLENLRAEMETVQGRVSRARDNAEEIEPNVSKWLSDVADVVKEADQFLAADMANLLNCCNNGCCPNIGSRRRLGKEAEEKLMDALKLREGGKFDSVGYRAPQTDTYLFSSATDSQHFESRASVYDQILDALKDDSIYMIGIYGMPGVGKTTMLDQVSKRAGDMKLFDEFAKAVVSQAPDHAKIQRDLAACLNLTLPKESQAQDASLLCRRLKIGKKILVILDDVWDPIKLHDIGIPSWDYIKGCKIVFTSRRQEVYVQMEIPKQFQIGVLRKSEAWSLFKNRVGNIIDDSHEISSLAEQVCGECGGLPLAIVTLGAALKEKKLHVWNDTLNQLKSCTADKIDGMAAQVYIPIELSYNFLQHSDTKAFFLYCCMYGEDEEICNEDLLWHGVGRRLLSSWDTVEEARQRVSTIVDTLKISCLLLEGKNENFVKMHDIIRDVAISIAAKDTQLKLLVTSGRVRQWPKEDELQHCRTFSCPYRNKEFPDVLECPELRTLALQADIQTSHSFLEVTKKLEVLYLGHMRFFTSASSISKLRVLSINYCNLEQLSFLKELKELEMLRINGSYKATLPLEVRELTQLRVLDLSRCYMLKVIPAGTISSLSKLEELYLPDGFHMWDCEGNAKLEELNSLRYLHILHIYIPTADASLLHERLCGSLIKFKISMWLPFNHPIGFDIHTRTLKLERIHLIGGPMALMKKATVVHLTCVQGLQKAFEDRLGGWFLDLKFLHVYSCDTVKENRFFLGKPKWNNPQVIQEGEGLTPSPFSNLNVLKVFSCRFKYLLSRSVVRGLLQLQELVVFECASIEEIVGDDDDTDSDEQVGNEVLVFSQLKILTLMRLPNLKGFYANTKTKSTTGPLFNEKVELPCLENLTLNFTSSLEEIWDVNVATVTFSKLASLRVEHCSKLTNIAPSKLIKSFHGLKELTLSSCLHLEEIFRSVEASNEMEEKPTNEIGNNLLFPQLEFVEFHDLPKLRSIYSRCSTSKLLASVTSLEIKGCSLLEKELARTTLEEKTE